MTQRQDHTVKKESDSFYKRGASWNPFEDDDSEMGCIVQPAGQPNTDPSTVKGLPANARLSDAASGCACTGLDVAACAHIFTAVVSLAGVSSGRPANIQPLQPWRKPPAKGKFATSRSISRSAPRTRVVFAKKRGRKGLYGLNSLLPPHEVIFAKPKAKGEKLKSRKAGAAAGELLQPASSFYNDVGSFQPEIWAPPVRSSIPPAHGSSHQSCSQKVEDKEPEEAQVMASLGSPLGQQLSAVCPPRNHAHFKTAF